MASSCLNSNGVTQMKWKPRKISAKRDFPTGEPQNISDNGYGVYQSPKRQKVDHEFSKSDYSGDDTEDLISVANLHECGLDSKPSGKESGTTNEKPISRMTNEHTENCEQIRSRKPRARVGSIPPGCVGNFTEEDLKLIETMSQTHMLTRKSYDIDDDQDDDDDEEEDDDHDEEDDDHDEEADDDE